MIVSHEHKLFSFVPTNCVERIQILGGRTSDVGEAGERWEGRGAGEEGGVGEGGR